MTKLHDLPVRAKGAERGWRPRSLSLSPARFGGIMKLELDEVRGRASRLESCDQYQGSGRLFVPLFRGPPAAAGGVVAGAERKTTTATSRGGVGDELGMANPLGPATWQRCAQSLANPKAKSYEISYPRSNTIPQSPFGVPLRDKYRPTVGIPGTVHAFNGEETVSGEPGAQGTQMDAIGHFAVLPEPWDGKGEFPGDKATY